MKSEKEHFLAFLVFGREKNNGKMALMWTAYFEYVHKNTFSLGRFCLQLTLDAMHSKNACLVSLSVVYIQSHTCFEKKDRVNKRNERDEKKTQQNA